LKDKKDKEEAKGGEKPKVEVSVAQVLDKTNL